MSPPNPYQAARWPLVLPRLFPEEMELGRSALGYQAQSRAKARSTVKGGTEEQAACGNRKPSPSALFPKGRQTGRYLASPNFGKNPTALEKRPLHTDTGKASWPRAHLTMKPTSNKAHSLTQSFSVPHTNILDSQSIIKASAENTRRIETKISKQIKWNVEETDYPRKRRKQTTKQTRSSVS